MPVAGIDGAGRNKYGQIAEHSKGGSTKYILTAPTVLVQAVPKTALRDGAMPAMTSANLAPSALESRLE